MLFFLENSICKVEKQFLFSFLLDNLLTGKSNLVFHWRLFNYDGKFYWREIPHDIISTCGDTIKLNPSDNENFS